MTLQIITSNIGNRTLYEGSFLSFRECAEQAIQEKTDLSGANFKNKNLSNACLDDGIFMGADFSGANLTGVNLSEANLQNSKFINTDLYNACFAYTNLKNCDFTGASFGATDITAANITASLFSTLSCFSLDFAGTSDMNNCRFTNDQGQHFIMSRPPVVVRGIGNKLIVFGEGNWLHGTSLLPYPENFHLLPLLRQTARNSG